MGGDLRTGIAIGEVLLTAGAAGISCDISQKEEVKPEVNSIQQAENIAQAQTNIEQPLDERTQELMNGLLDKECDDGNIVYFTSDLEMLLDSGVPLEYASQLSETAVHEQLISAPQIIQYFQEGIDAEDALEMFEALKDAKRYRLEYRTYTWSDTDTVFDDALKLIKLGTDPEYARELANLEFVSQNIARIAEAERSINEVRQIHKTFEEAEFYRTRDSANDCLADFIISGGKRSDILNYAQVLAGHDYGWRGRFYISRNLASLVQNDVPTAYLAAIMPIRNKITMIGKIGEVYATGVPIDYMQSIAESLTGTIFTTGDPENLIRAFERGITPEDVEQMIQILPGSPPLKLLAKGVTRSFAEEIIQLFQPEDITGFDFEYGLEKLAENNVPIEYIREAVAAAQNNEHVQDVLLNLNDLARIYNGGTTITEIIPILERIQGMYCVIADEGTVNVEELSNYINSVDEMTREQVFSGVDLTRMYLAGATIDQVQQWVDVHNPQTEDDAYAIRQAIMFGITPQDMMFPEDTEKPDALVVFPREDWNRAFERYTEFVKENIKPNYDTYFLTASNEDDLLKAVEKYEERGLGPDLVILSGHGSPRDINFGDAEEQFSEEAERLYLDFTDTDLFKRLYKILPDGATIMLNACETGYGDPDQCFAQRIYEAAEGKRIRIIASKISKNASNMVVYNTNPLTFAIREQGLDCTFRRENR